MVGDAQLFGEDAYSFRDGAAVRLVLVLHCRALRLRRVSSGDLRGDFILRKPPPADQEDPKMPTERSIVTREVLYELLWKSPLRDVARRLHIAPSSLKRVCRQLRVPVPGISHWRKKWEGREGERPPLPPVAEGEPTEVLLRRRRAAEPPRATPAADSQAATESPRPRVHVPEQLCPLDPVLREAMPVSLVEIGLKAESDDRECQTGLDDK